MRKRQARAGHLPQVKQVWRREQDTDVARGAEGGGVGHLDTTPRSGLGDAQEGAFGQPGCFDEGLHGALGRVPAASAKGTKPAKAAKPAKQAKPAKKAAKKAKGGERANKKAEVIAMMKRAGGATLGEIMKATGWQKHTVRGFVSILGSKGGQKIESTKNAAGERTYKIAR